MPVLAGQCRDSIQQRGSCLGLSGGCTSSSQHSSSSARHFYGSTVCGSRSSRRS
jgi:hypothetical protein